MASNLKIRTGKIKVSRMRIQTGGELSCLMEYIILKKTIQVKEREDYAAPDGATYWYLSI